jgi:hypothetical protein
MLPNSRVGIKPCVRDHTLSDMPSRFTYYASSTHDGAPEPQRTHYDPVRGSKACLGSYRDRLWRLNIVGHTFWSNDKDLENCVCYNERVLSHLPMRHPPLPRQGTVDHRGCGDNAIDVPECPIHPPGDLGH